MSHEIEVIENDKIIKLTYSGHVTLDERLCVINELILEYNLYEKFRVIIDVRQVTNNLSEVEQKLFGQFVATQNELAGASVAVVHAPNRPINSNTNPPRQVPTQRELKALEARH